MVMVLGGGGGSQRREKEVEVLGGVRTEQF